MRRDGTVGLVRGKILEKQKAVNVEFWHYVAGDIIVAFGRSPRGASGGPVFNSDGEVVGIVFCRHNYAAKTYFMGIKEVKRFLKEYNFKLASRE